MKTDTRTTTLPKDSAQRAAAVATPPPVSGAATDLEAELLALAREEESLNQRKAQRREQYWSVSIDNLSTSIEKLVTNGFDRPTIAKALGFASTPKASTSPKKGTGPTTHDGWYGIFLNTGIRSYLKAHPDLASTLRLQKVPSTDYPSRLPVDDWTAIQAAARAKAQAKCPASTPTQASTL